MNSIRHPQVDYAAGPTPLSQYRMCGYDIGIPAANSGFKGQECAVRDGLCVRVVACELRRARPAQVYSRGIPAPNIDMERRDRRVGERHFPGRLKLV